MKLRTRFKPVLVPIIALLLVVTLALGVSAVCDTKFVNYYGSCPNDGDIQVYDSQDNLVVEQFYTLNKGCYNGNYFISVPGGENKDCVVRPSERLHFKLGTVEMGSIEWSPSPSTQNLDLVRPLPPMEQMPKRGKTSNLFYIVSIILLVIIAIVAVWHYQKKEK